MLILRTIVVAILVVVLGTSLASGQKSDAVELEKSRNLKRFWKAAVENSEMLQSTIQFVVPSAEKREKVSQLIIDSINSSQRGLVSMADAGIDADYARVNSAGSDSNEKSLDYYYSEIGKIAECDMTRKQFLIRAIRRDRDRVLELFYGYSRTLNEKSEADPSDSVAQESFKTKLRSIEDEVRKRYGAEALSELKSCGS